MCRHGWLFIYHGVHDIGASSPTGFKLCYSAGAMVLSKENPKEIIYRSRQPVLVPDGPLECHGTVDDVVFPSGIDRRNDLGATDRFDVLWYGG
jgi:beta-1,2-mannobiose phosphorylase / 1,2-beta-oligomannan phosphorylase